MFQKNQQRVSFINDYNSFCLSVEENYEEMSLAKRLCEMDVELVRQNVPRISVHIIWYTHLQKQSGNTLSKFSILQASIHFLSFFVYLTFRASFSLVIAQRGKLG